VNDVLGSKKHKSTIVLVISLCSKKLSEEEFVKPIIRVVLELIIGAECFSKHYSSVTDEDVRQCTHVIISGNPLMDHEFEGNTGFLTKVLGLSKPVLCICAGMQALALQRGLTLRKDERIGLFKVTPLARNSLFNEASSAYFLHSKSASDWVSCKEFEVIANSNGITAMVQCKAEKVFAVLFHPEVRNQEVISNFLRL
jgi:anthranilate/para-aminobenzoate synthase component II